MATFDLSTFTYGNPVPSSFDPGRYTPPPKPQVESFPLDVEKVKAGVKIPAFLPYFDNLQNVDETPAMRLAYRRMLADPNVKAAFMSKIFSVMALNLTVGPPKHLKKDKRSIEIAEFNEWNLKQGLTEGVPGMVWDIMSGALIDGYSVCEKVWGSVEQKGRYKGKRRLRALKAKDVDQDIVPEIDEYKNLVAIRGLRYNAWEAFDPRDFVIYTHLGLFENPTGMSDFRAVYSRYWILDAVWKLRAMACDKRAIPLLVGLWKDPANRGHLERALAAARYQNWISAPADAQITAVNIAGQADQIFADTIKDLREEIIIGIKGSTLTAMTSEDHRGDSKVHENTSDLWSWQLCVAILNLLNGHENGLIRDITDRNYTGVDEYPQAMMAGTDDKALKDSLDILRGLVKDLTWSASRDQVEDRFGWKWEEDPAQAIRAAPPPGMGPPGMPGTPPGAPGAPPPGGQPPPEPMPGATHPAPDGAANPEGNPAADPNQEDLGDPEQRADAMADIMGGAFGSDEALDAIEHAGNANVRKFSEGDFSIFLATAVKLIPNDSEAAAGLAQDAYARRDEIDFFGEKTRQSLFDIDDEPRDEKGRWTTGGKKAEKPSTDVDKENGSGKIPSESSDQPKETKMTMIKKPGSFDYQPDDEIPSFAGVKLEDGVRIQHPQAGEAVKFKDTRKDGKAIQPIIKLAGKPKLQAALAAHEKKQSEYADAVASNVPGLNELKAEKAKGERIGLSFEQMMNDENNDGVRMPPALPKTNFKELAAKYPRAALYLKAESQRDSATCADNTGKGAAAENAIDIIKHGGTLEEAQTALSERRKS